VLTLPARVRVFVAIEPFDMRGSFDRAAGTARRLGLDPLDGAYYVFVSRSRKQVAILHFDGSGWCIFRKRLEVGTFELPEVAPGAQRVVVDGRVLASMLAGIDLRAPRRGWYERAERPIPELRRSP
jgi:transposase